MRATILAGAIAALIYGGTAAAADGDCPPTRADARSGSSGDLMAQAQDSNFASDPIQEDDTVIIETEPVKGADGSLGQDEGVGGSGDDLSSKDQGIGGGGDAPADAQGEVRLNMPLKCTPANEASGTGGSGSSSNLQPQSSAPAESFPATPPPPPPAQSYPAQPPPPPVQSSDATGGSGYGQPPPATAFTPSSTPRSDELETVNVEEKKKDKNDTRGLTLLVGGGVEGYTGALAPQLDPGPAYGVTASIKPSRVFGIELGYTGAVNNIDRAGVGGSGPDLVRNGGQAVATLNLFATDWSPFVLGGIGISDYNFRNGRALGFQDDTVGTIPAGVGLRGHVGHFTLDARANYNFLFDKEFAPGIPEDGGDFGGGGSYAGTINLGGTF